MRLNNTSQLAGFTKRDDLRYFLREICGAEYHHEPALAPTKEILDAYKKKQISWEEYETRYVALLAQRGAETAVDRRLFDVPAVFVQRAQARALPPAAGGGVPGGEVGKRASCPLVGQARSSNDE